MTKGDPTQKKLNFLFDKEENPAAMLDHVSKELPGQFSWSHPPGGVGNIDVFYFWLQSPDIQPEGHERRDWLIQEFLAWRAAAPASPSPATRPAFAGVSLFRPGLEKAPTLRHPWLRGLHAVCATMHYDENSRTATEAAFVRMNSTMPMQYPSHHQNEQLCLFEYYYDSHYPNSTESEEPLRLWFLKHDVAAPRGETHDIRVAVRFGSDALDVKREMIEFLKLEGGIYQNAGVTILLNDDAGEAVADKKIITVSDAKKKSKEYVPEKSDMSIVIETRNKAIYIDNKYGRIVCPAKHPLVLWDCIWEAALILAAESDPPVVGKP